MIMMGPKRDKGGVAALISRKLQGKPGDYEEMKESNGEYESDYSHGYDSAMDAFFEAVESKDVSKAKHALKSFVEMCLREKSSEHSDSDSKQSKSSY